MKGSAPYCPTTGSHVVPVRNDHPNFSRGNAEFVYSSNTSSVARARMVSAQVSVMTYAISSPLRRRCQKAEARPEGRVSSAVGAVADIRGWLYPGPGSCHYWILSMALSSL